MAQYDFYVDIISGTLVTGPSNTAAAAFPKLVQGDTISLRIYLLARTPTYPNSTPYTVIDSSSFSMKVALGPKDGTAGSTLYTQQFTWVPDAAHQYNAANLPLNTAGITSLIGSATSGSAWFEIEISQGGFPTTVFQRQVTIEAEVIETGVITVPPGATGITAEEVNGQFVKNVNTGFIIQCATDATKKVFVYVDAAGTLHMDPIT